MRSEATGYVLKEYGSWSVLSVSFLAGLAVCREGSWLALPLFIALGLLINSKQAFTKWVRRKGDQGSLLIFLGQVVLAAAILIVIFQSDVMRLLPLLVFPTAYLVSNRLAGEHHIVTELLGFVLISLAAVLAKFLVTGGLDVRLFMAVSLYFSAGVFKVKSLLLHRTRDRIMAVLWVLLAFLVYRAFHIPRLILLPLCDNVLAALTLYKVRLKTTGWIEVVKSFVFLGFLSVHY